MAKIEFKGYPITRYSEYNFLTGNFGKEVLREYNSIVDSEFRGHPKLKILNLKKNLEKYDPYVFIYVNEFLPKYNLDIMIVKGTNTYATLIMNNRVLPKYGLRTINPSDVRRIINVRGYIEGIYSDLGVVLKDEDKYNESYLERELISQAKDRKYEFSSLNPLVFTPSCLDIVRDYECPLGLNFKIREDAQPFNAPELSVGNHEKMFNTTNYNGMPIFEKHGCRTNNSKNSGLCRLLLTYNLGLDSSIQDFSGSSKKGRIVVINEGREVK